MKQKSGRHKILIVDDHSILREGLALLINQQENLVVCAEAEDVETAQRYITEHKPELVILDISLKGISGLELLNQIRNRNKEILVLILSMHDEIIFIERAFKAGANGYVRKKEGAKSLISAIQTVVQGEVYLGEDLRNQFFNSYFNRNSGRISSLTDRLTNREFEVLQLIGCAYETRQIATQLHISVKTVESYRQHIKEKLSLKSTTELVQYAYQLVRGELD